METSLLSEDLFPHIPVDQLASCIRYDKLNLYGKQKLSIFWPVLGGTLNSEIRDKPVRSYQAWEGVLRISKEDIMSGKCTKALTATRDWEEPIELDDVTVSFE